MNPLDFRGQLRKVASDSGRTIGGFVWGALVLVQEDIALARGWLLELMLGMASALPTLLRVCTC